MRFWGFWGFRVSGFLGFLGFWVLVSNFGAESMSPCQGTARQPDPSHDIKRPGLIRSHFWGPHTGDSATFGLRKGCPFFERCPT